MADFEEARQHGADIPAQEPEEPMADDEPISVRDLPAFAMTALTAVQRDKLIFAMNSKRQPARGSATQASAAKSRRSPCYAS